MAKKSHVVFTLEVNKKAEVYERVALMNIVCLIGSETAVAVAKDENAANLMKKDATQTFNSLS